MFAQLDAIDAPSPPPRPGHPETPPGALRRGGWGVTSAGVATVEPLLGPLRSVDGRQNGSALGVLQGVLTQQAKLLSTGLRQPALPK